MGYEVHLGFSNQPIYLKNFRLFVMLGIDHLTIQVILVYELERCCKNY